MKITVLKECKIGETRTALRPDQAAELVSEGHAIFVEYGTGVPSGFSDADYQRAGCFVGVKEKVISAGELILKVKAPLPGEYRDYNSSKVLFTYLHLDENIPPEEIRRFISSRVMGIAYEWVGENGNYPLLTPMSRLTGYLFAQKAAELCAQYKGVFLPRNERFMTGGQVLVIGTGNIGLSAIKFFLDLRSSLTVLTKDEPDIFNQKLNHRYETKDINYIDTYSINILKMDMDRPELTRCTLDEAMPELDIIINYAVRRPNLPKSHLPFLIDKEMIKRMDPGSVVCDATACDADLIETCTSSPLLDKVDIYAGVIHYSCDHIPSLVPKTATKLLTDETFPFIHEIATKGVKTAVTEDKRLANGVVCYRNQITHAYTAQKKGFSHRSVSCFMGDIA